MRARISARAWLLGTVAVGGCALFVALLLRRTDASLATLALLGAAVVLAELLEVPKDESSLDPGDAHSLSFSSSIHLAAVLLIGPWTGALVAAFGVLVVDPLRGSRRQAVAYNASVFALSAVAGGYAFLLAGGEPGAPALPGDFPALAALALAYYGVNNGFMSAIVALAENRPFWPLAREATRDGFAAGAGEFGLAVAITFLAVHEPYAIIALAPLMIAAYRSYERLATLRRETARALETFANVVDERDPSTFEHSARVAQYVGDLTEALHLPPGDVARLRWAGRLHDLGKIAVDASVLRKPARLNDEEWMTMWRHPRLSARLLRRFRFAGDQAKAVEYHHERFDGGGYYAIDRSEIPLAAHVLAVADSYDAMTSDRSYRPGLAPEVALAEIEAESGKQFHPAVARAFVALQRGEDPLAALTHLELREIRNGLRAGPQRRGRPAIRPETVAAGAVVASLGAIGLGASMLTVPVAAVGVFALAYAALQQLRARRLAVDLRATLERGGTVSTRFAALQRQLHRSCPLDWVGLVSWRDRECRGVLEQSWGEAGPSETALMSWLLCETETTAAVIVAPAGDLGGRHVHVAVPLRRKGALLGYLVLALAGAEQRVERALGACAEELAAGLIPLRPAQRPHLEALAS